MPCRVRRPSRRARWALAILALLALAGGAPAAQAQSTADVWNRVTGTPAPSHRGNPPAVRPDRFRAYALDHAGMRAALAGAPRPAGGAPLVLALPDPSGTFRRFAVRESPVMAPQLAAKYPAIKSYAGRGLDDLTATVRLDLGPVGFHASVRGAGSVWYIDPYYQRDRSLYVSYHARDLTRNPHGDFIERGPLGEPPALGAPRREALGANVIRRTYRLALVSDPTYADYFSDTGDSPDTVDAKVTAAKVALMNRVNQPYEDDLAIHMDLVANNDLLNFNTYARMTGADGPCGSAPCYTTAQATDGCTGELLDRNHVVIGQMLPGGASSYDIGHIGLGLNGGGIAYLGVVGWDHKGGGCTGVPTPVGDLFAVDYVAHEMGHQFAGNHTFNGVNGACALTNRNPETSVEPGSGSTIMAYAGICGQDDLQPHSDPYFSQRSIGEATAYTTASIGPLNEMQTVSLSGFGDPGDSFKLQYGSSPPQTITPANYNKAGLEAAIAAIVGTSVTVDQWGAYRDNPTPLIDNTGFQVTFDSDANLQLLTIVDPVGTSGFVGETDKGGPVDNKGNAGTTGNRSPDVTAPAARWIPRRTPFALTAAAGDADGNPLTYSWEQNDAGGASGTPLSSNVKADGPLFRTFGTAGIVAGADTLLSPSPGENTVTGDPTRVFPDYAQVLADNTNAKTGACPAPANPDPDEPMGQPQLDCYSEFLPTESWVGTEPTTPGALHFRVTVRDGVPGAGGVGHADTTLTVAPAAGPFLVTSQGSPATIDANRTLGVTWDVAGTNAPPVGTTAVRISLFKNGGTIPATVLADSTPNDGAETVTIPTTAGGTATRIKIEAVDNYFFDLSDADLVVKAAPAIAAPANAAVAYSDGTDSDVRLSDDDGPGSGLHASVTGLPAGVTLVEGAPSADGTRPGTRAYKLTGKVTDAPGTYNVNLSATDSEGRTTTHAFPLVVAPEMATVTYTGDTEASTGTRLAAQLTDPDGSNGDLRTATVTFKEGATTLCGPVAVSASGGAECNASLSGVEHPVDVVAGGRYAGSVRTILRPNPVLCTAAIVLTDVSRSGRRVRLAGFTERRYAGRRVVLRASGRRVGTAAVRPDGSFATRVRAPRGPGAGITSYTAEIDRRRSAALQLSRRLTITTARVAAGVRVRGRLAGTNRARRRLTVQRSLGCAQPTAVRTIRTDRRGRFTVTLRRPATGGTAVFRIRTASGRPRTFSLPVVIVGS
jgi:hypothetical protein